MQVKDVRYARCPDGTAIAYAVIGAGLPLLVPSPLGNFSRVMEHERLGAWYEQLGRGRTLIPYDPRGVGLSERGIESFALDGVVSDTQAVAADAGVERFDLFAFYRWTPAAIALASLDDTPVDRLVLYHAYSDGKRLLDQPAASTFLRLTAGDHQTAARLISTLWGAPPEDAEAVAKLAEEALTQADYLRLLESIAGWNVTALLNDVKIPVLVVHRAENTLVPIEFAREIAAGIPKARLKVFPGRGGPFYGDIEPELASIAEFLRRDREPDRERTYVAEPAPSSGERFPDGLTEREVEVLGLVAGGKTSPEIADALVLSVRTVERHVANIYLKTDTHGRAQATAYALKHGLA